MMRAQQPRIVALLILGPLKERTGDYYYAIARAIVGYPSTAPSLVVGTSKCPAQASVPHKQVSRRECPGILILYSAHTKNQCHDTLKIGHKFKRV